VSELRSPFPPDPPFVPSTSGHLLDDVGPASPAGEAPGLSEGLPPGFRMRHDARRLHHVFAPAQPGARVNGEPAAAATTPAAGVRGEAGSRLEPSAARELTRHLGAIAACLHVLAEDGRSLREQALTDLARSELQRATFFVQGLQVLGEDPVLTRGNIRLAELLEQTLAAVEPERRLAAVEASLDLSSLDVLVAGDARWLGVCLAGMATALLAVLQAHRVRGARLEVGGTASAAAVSVQMAQDVVTFPTALLPRFFHLDWAERPGGPMAAVPLVASARLAELHGGRLTVTAGPRGGCAMGLTLPRAR
jgi:hypothetical protein